MKPPGAERERKSESWHGSIVRGSRSPWVEVGRAQASKVKTARFGDASLHLRNQEVTVSFWKRIYFPSFYDNKTALACLSLHIIWWRGPPILSYMGAQCLKKKSSPTPQQLREQGSKCRNRRRPAGELPGALRAAPTKQPSFPVSVSPQSLHFSLSSQLLFREGHWSGQYYG